ncbi:nuclear nucleic acid-binding protein C1D [Aplochiton taeniatus]
MADDHQAEDYPSEIDDQLKGFELSAGAINSMVQTMLSMPRNELLTKLDPLDQAKLDLMSVYTLNSLFWMYLVTQGINPKEHGIKQELERIRTYMNRVKEITDRRKAARLDKGAAARFVKNALWDSEEGKAQKAGGSSKPGNTPGRSQQAKRPKLS